MDIFYCIMVFIIGTVFGSFFTLAVYRIPLKKDITHERSFCPNCNHRLEFLDLIPVLSYLFLGGKCRYCGQKIRIRYLLLEVLSGIVFLLGYLALNMQFPYFTISKIAYFIAFVFMYVTLAIILGIDKENRNIHKGVLTFGWIMQGIYILYLYVMYKNSMYRYSMYLILMIILFIIDTVLMKKKGKNNYVLQILMLLTYIAACVGEELSLIIILVSILLIALYNLIFKILLKKEIPQTRIGFFLCLTTIVLFIIESYMKFYL